ncbi:WGxxGxxG family protein [Chelativorans sp. BNC1]|jgi:LPXTG-motif cell wall-anchored protein|uniref:WGxxGxxG family protein n=1 Tax=Chelativorans TaxID=449972 RepID=UPI000A036872
MLTKSLFALMVAASLTASAAPAFSQETTTPPAGAEDTGEDFDWGWLGLLGLLGLGGLMGRSRRNDTVGRTNVR